MYISSAPFVFASSCHSLNCLMVVDHKRMPLKKVSNKVSCRVTMLHSIALVLLHECDFGMI